MPQRKPTADLGKVDHLIRAIMLSVPFHAPRIALFYAKGRTRHVRMGFRSLDVDIGA